MISIDRLSIGILILGIICMIPSYTFLGFIDEICVYAYLVLALVVCAINGGWWRFRLLWLSVGVMGVYAVYSIFFMHFNTTPFILMDVVIEMKPYIPFLVLFAIAPKVCGKWRRGLKVSSVFNMAFVGAVLLCGPYVTSVVIGEPYVSGVVMYVSVLVFLMVSLERDGSIPNRERTIAMIALTIGLLCGRSKYYGMYVLTVFFLYVYRPGMIKNLNAKYLSLTTGVIILILMVSWQKINYYFIMGNGDTFDPNVIQSYARPVLYATFFLILLDYFPLGSGLASFATYPSQANYSSLYYDYGLNNIHGLSPQMPDFICDAFYPSLAQFGIVGIVLFITLWVYAYKYVRPLVFCTSGERNGYFILGSLSICFILIESIGGGTFTQSPGMVAMCILGIICGKGRDVAISSERDEFMAKQSDTPDKKIVKI